MLYANGFGPTVPPVVPGSATQTGNLAVQPVIQIGGIPRLPSNSPAPVSPKPVSIKRVRSGVGAQRR